MPSDSAAMSQSHQYRVISVVNFFVAFALCIASAHVNKMAFPSVGLAPATTSALGSLYIQRYVSRRQDDKPSLSSIAQTLIVVFDISHAALFLIMVILTWVTIDRWYTSSPELLAYATFPMLVDFILHSYLTLELIYKAVKPHLSWLSFGPRKCPHCHMPMSTTPVLYTGTRYASIPSSPEAADLYTDDHSDDAQSIAIRPSMDEDPTNKV